MDYMMALSWKAFNVNLSTVHDSVLGLCASFTGPQAIAERLELWFSSEPSQEEKDAIQSYWDGLTEESSEATSYKSRDQLIADRDSKRASAAAKLEVLGLTADEIAAILGQ